VPQRAVPQPRVRPQPGDRQTMLNDKVEKLQATVTQQQKQIETLTTQLREQAAQIQKVNAQLEMIRPTPRVVENR
jgi:septal ring factor EnvC (AmiA/AmiB activator)